MSLFEDPGYRYRETCFVVFPKSRRPELEELLHAFEELGDRYQLSSPRRTAEGVFDSITIRCPYDHAALDVTYLEGEAVLEQLDEMEEELSTLSLSEADRERLRQLRDCDARFDVFHFEEVVSDDPEEALLDPGALLVVLQKLTQLTHGIGVDPLSGTLL